MSATELFVNPDVAEWATELRREIHRHPELGFEEDANAALVERELTRWASSTGGSPRLVSWA